MIPSGEKPWLLPPPILAALFKLLPSSLFDFPSTLMALEANKDSCWWLWISARKFMAKCYVSLFPARDWNPIPKLFVFWILESSLAITLLSLSEGTSMLYLPYSMTSTFREILAICMLTCCNDSSSCSMMFGLTTAGESVAFSMSFSMSQRAFLVLSSSSPC